MKKMLFSFLIATLAVSVPAFARGSKPQLLAPTDVQAYYECSSLDVSWDAVTNATKYSVEVTVEYDTTSGDCSNPPNLTMVYTFTTAAPTTNISIPYSSFTQDFGYGDTTGCGDYSVKVKGINPPTPRYGSQNNPFSDPVTPSPDCF